MSFLETGGLSIAIVGATGCIGRELAQQIPSLLPVRKLLLFASQKREGDVVEVAQRPIKIHGLSPEGIPVEVMEELDVVFFACPPQLVRAHAEPLLEDGIAVFDLTGALVGNAGFSLYGVVNNEHDFSEHRVCVLPSPVGAALARLLYALQGQGPFALQASISVSASTFGQNGVEELSNQVSSLFMCKEPIKQVFPTGLAFDIVPIVGQLQEDGVSSAERRINLEVASLLSMNPQMLRSTLQLSPIFTGVVAQVTVSFEGDVAVDDIIEDLIETDGIAYHALPPGPKSLDGKPEVFVGRVRPNHLARGVDIWLCSDNVSSAVHNALSLAVYYHSIDLV